MRLTVLLLALAAPALAQPPSRTPFPSGTLVLQFTIPIPNAPNATFAGSLLVDLNHDGRPDLLRQSVSPNTFSIRLNDGQGNFLPPTDFPIVDGTGQQTFLVADFDSDGYPDVLVLGLHGMFLYSGDGVGNLRAGHQTNIGVELIAYAAATADFNRDGHPDLIISSVSGPGVRVFLGDGQGQFTEVPEALSGIPTSYGASSFQIADFNGDSIPDLAFSSSSGKALQVATGDGQGHFQNSVTLPLTPDERGVSLVAGDWNGDGFPDLAAVSSSVVLGRLLPNGILTVFLNNRAGQFTATARPIPSVQASQTLTTADFDGDGYSDLALDTDSVTTTLLFGDGTGNFLPRAAFTLPNSYRATPADLNGDGRPDLFVRQLSGYAVYLGAQVPTALQLIQEPLNPFSFGQTIALDLNFSYPQAFTTPVGTVSLFDGQTLLATRPLPLPGTAPPRFVLPFVAGIHQFRAVYSGDPRFTAAFFSLTVVETGQPAHLDALDNSLPLRILITDFAGDPVPNAGVIFTATPGAFNGATSILVPTDASGIATAPLLTSPTPAAFTITATVSGYPNLNATFTFATQRPNATGF